ncbi:MAG TPA: hypothetical protein DIS96_15200, partial [Pusillimonas sp.]|nr:hypothetical protein [Pusillimonas sp.]
MTGAAPPDQLAEGIVLIVNGMDARNRFQASISTITQACIVDSRGQPGGVPINGLVLRSVQMFARQERAAVLPRIPLGVPATHSAGSGVVNALGADQALLVVVLVMPAMTLGPGKALLNNPPLGVQLVGLLPDDGAAGA